VASLNIIPIKVSYPTPKGYKNGTTVYEVSSGEKPEGYLGRHNNQLIADGELFKKSYPKLEEPI